MKVFFICSDIPYPGFTGGSTINWSMLENLINNDHEVTLFCDAPRAGWNEIDKQILKKMYLNLKKIKCNVVHLNDLKLNKKIGLLKKIFSNKIENYIPECNYSNQIENILLEKLNKINPDFFLIEGHAGINHSRNIKIKKIGWSVNPVKHLNDIRIKYQKKNTLNILKILIKNFKINNFQKFLINDFNNLDLRFNLSKDFIDVLDKIGLKKTHHIIPPFYDASKLLGSTASNERSFFKIVIIGLMSTVNKSQLEILQNYVFPEIEKKLLEDKIQFHFIGTSKENLPKNLKNKKYIKCRGFIENALYEIKDSDLFFCVTPHPLGFRTRICEALSLGACILTSAYDQISIPFLKNDENCIIVDKLENSGKAVIDLIKNTNKINYIKTNARKAYEDFLSQETAGKKFNKFIEEFINS